MDTQRFPPSTAGVTAQVIVHLDEAGELIVENNVRDLNPWSKQGTNSNMSMGFVSCIGPGETLRTKVMNTLTTYCAKGAVFPEKKATKRENSVLLTTDKPMIKLENGASALFPLHLLSSSEGKDFQTLMEFCLYVSTCVILTVNQDFIDSFSINLNDLIGDSKKLLIVIVYWDWVVMKAGGKRFNKDLIGEEAFKLQANTGDPLTAKAVEFLKTFEPYFDHSFVCFPSSKNLEHSLVIRKVKEVIENLSQAPSIVEGIKLRANNFEKVVRKFVQKSNCSAGKRNVTGGRVVAGKNALKRSPGVSSVYTPRQGTVEECSGTPVLVSVKSQKDLEVKNLGSGSGNVLEDRFKVMYLTLFHKEAQKCETVYLAGDQVMSIHSDVLHRCRSKMLATHYWLTTVNVNWVEYAQPLLDRFLAETGKNSLQFEKLCELYKTYFLDALRYVIIHLANRGSSNTVESVLLRCYPDKLAQFMESANPKIQEYFNRLLVIFTDDLCQSETCVRNYQSLLDEQLKEMYRGDFASQNPLIFPDVCDLNFSPEVSEVIGDSVLLQRLTQSILEWELKKAQGLQNQLYAALQEFRTPSIADGTFTRDSLRNRPVQVPPPKDLNHPKEMALRVDKVPENMLSPPLCKVQKHSQAETPVYENVEALRAKATDKIEASPNDDSADESRSVSPAHANSRSFHTPDVDDATVKAFYSSCLEDAIKVYANKLFIQPKDIQYMHAVALKQCAEFLLPNFRQIGIVNLENKISKVVEAQLQTNLKFAKKSEKSFYDLCKDCDSYFVSVESTLKEKMADRESFAIRDLCSDKCITLSRKLKQVSVMPNVRDYFKQRIAEFNYDIQNIVSILLKCRDSLSTVSLKSRNDAEQQAEYWMKTAVCLKIACKSREPYLKAFLVELIQNEIDDILGSKQKQRHRRIDKSKPVSNYPANNSSMPLERRFEYGKSGSVSRHSPEVRLQRSVEYSRKQPSESKPAQFSPDKSAPLSMRQQPLPPKRPEDSMAHSHASRSSFPAPENSAASLQEESMALSSRIQEQSGTCYRQIPPLSSQREQYAPEEEDSVVSPVHMSVTIPDKSSVASPAHSSTTHAQLHYKASPIPKPATPPNREPYDLQSTSRKPHPPSKTRHLPSISPKQLAVPTTARSSPVDPKQKPNQQQPKPLNQPSPTSAELQRQEDRLLKHGLQTYEEFMQTATNKSFYSDKNLSEMHERIKYIIADSLSRQLDAGVRSTRFFQNLSVQLNIQFQGFMRINQENVKLNQRKRQKVTEACIRILHQELKKHLFDTSNPDAILLQEARSIALAHVVDEAKDENEFVIALWQEEANNMMEAYLKGDYGGAYGCVLDLNGESCAEISVAEESPGRKRERVKGQLRQTIKEMQAYLKEFDEEGPVQRYVRQIVDAAVKVLGDTHCHDVKLKMTLEGLQVVQERL